MIRFCRIKYWQSGVAGTNSSIVGVEVLICEVYISICGESGPGDGSENPYLLKGGLSAGRRIHVTWFFKCPGILSGPVRDLFHSERATSRSKLCAPINPDYSGKILDQRTQYLEAWFRIDRDRILDQRSSSLRSGCRPVSLYQRLLAQYDFQYQNLAGPVVNQ